ncbi:MAG: glutamine-hydrolyzing GMP synthase, partial [Acidobacteriota bacterium]|nr:glutamine-hydrolyzing GMP synthase [Acidobacteriota bacterium]
MYRENILILDFGSQYTQLIARRVRELSVYCEIVPYTAAMEKIRSSKPVGIILSGGPDSVCREGSPSLPREAFETGIPTLGICYGLQLMAQTLGGKVVPGGDRREFGKATVEVLEPGTLFSNLPESFQKQSQATQSQAPQFQAWMSHGDRVTELPPGFRLLAKSGGGDNAIVAAAADEKRNLWGLQFHPEVVHSLCGREILENFLVGACGCNRDWTMSAFIESTVRSLSETIGSDHTAICGLSGGVDSTVAALLVQKAIGDRLTCVFVDNGLLRKDEFRSVLEMYRQNLKLKVVGVDAGERFLTKLKDVEEPERKRKIIGEEFIRV